MERKLLQIAFASAGLVLVGFGLAGVSRPSRICPAMW